MSARPLFVGGTSSNAGKSWMVTAICAWLRRRGVSVAPFKALNMSNNSCPCPGGGEIGRAQVAQAEACGLVPETAMNPVLLKPNGQGTSQVVVNGHMWKTLTAREYLAESDRLRGLVLDAYRYLADRFDVIVMEGAGSVSELNLRSVDVANLGLVTALDAPWILVADIERGGVFGSVIGTVSLLSQAERALFRGFAINKFHGDLSLFEDGVRMLEERTGSLCLGVFPYLPDVYLDPEDSLALKTTRTGATPSGARTAIVRLPHLSNSTDFRLLTWADWLIEPSLAEYDVIVLPGTKNTLADLAWLHSSGLASWIVDCHRQGAKVIGICGGYQMLGRIVRDPHAVESPRGEGRGLGLLPAETTLATSKVTRTVSGTTMAGHAFDGYEIHLGTTRLDMDGSWRPFARLSDGTADGAVANGVVGTYVHGALEDPAVCAELLGVNIGPGMSKTANYERLADWFGAHAKGFGPIVGRYGV